MGTKLLLGFGSTANQAVVHQRCEIYIQRLSFGSTANQVVVHPLAQLPTRYFVSEVPQTKQ